MGVLRVILALCVFFFHTGWLGGFALIGPYRAVYSFFIISGFYMALILNKKYVGTRSVYRLFIANRFLRIYPIYWLILVLTGIFSAALLRFGIDTGDLTRYLHYYQYLATHGSVGLVPIVAASDIITNVTLIIRNSYFTVEQASTTFSTLAMAWTLIIELLFYLVAPFLVRRKGLSRFMVIVGVFLNAYLFFHFRWLDYRLTTYAFIHLLQYFMLGYISFLIYDSCPMRKVPKPLVYVLTALSWVFVLGYTSLPLPHLQYKWMVFNEWIYYGIVTAAVPFLFQFSKQAAWDNSIADLSYPIYISHLFTAQVLTYAHIAKPHTQEFTILALVATILFSMAIVVLVEKPIDRFRQQRIESYGTPVRSGDQGTLRRTQRIKTSRSSAR